MRHSRHMPESGGKLVAMSAWFERVVEVLDKCETPEQVFDVDNDRYIRDNIIGHRITVTSVRKQPSDYHNGIYAVIGFTNSDNNGQFTIGGNGARYPLMLSRFNRLPADLILYTADTPYGFIYKWKRAES
jgi:hypothetical protein